MRWSGWRAKYHAKAKWHEWFAWHPVTFGDWPNPTGEAVWLERIERRIVIFSDGESGDRYEYRAAQVPKEPEWPRPVNLFELESDLIDPDQWTSLYGNMPIKCREVVDGKPECLGIGWNKLLGWFIMGSGQGPELLWVEKGTVEGTICG